MRLRFTAQANQNLIAIAEYIRERNPAAALVVRAAILDFLQHIVAFPELGRRETIEGVRKLVTRKYRYLIYYTIDQENEEVIVLTIPLADACTATGNRGGLLPARPSYTGSSGACSRVPGQMMPPRSPKVTLP